MVEPTKDELLAALSDASVRVVSLVRSLGPDDGDKPVPGLEWTIAETVAHVVTVAGRLLGDKRRSARAEETAALNELCLGEFAERNLARLVDRLENDLRTVVERVYPKVDFDRQHRFHGGRTISGAGGAAFFLCELLVHGWDIAMATGKHWTIPSDEARIAVAGPLEVGLSAASFPADTDPCELLLGLFRRRTPSDPQLVEALAAVPPI